MTWKVGDRVTNRQITRWGLEWRSDSRLDGPRAHIVCHKGGMPAMFRTRREARNYATERYGYIRNRPDLQSEPHGWKMPRPVRLRVEVAQ